RLAMLERMLRAAHESLAHGRSHGAAEERELERTSDDRQAVQRAGHHDQRIFLLRRLLRLRESIAILLRVAKLQRIFRLDIVRELDIALGIEERLQAFALNDPHVVPAVRTYVQIALELGPIQNGFAG